MSALPELTVIVPVLDEERFVVQVIERVLALPLDLEVLVVDDGSTDGSPELVRGLDDPRVRLWVHDANRGKGAAVRTALGQARGRVVAIQDADLEYPPENLVPLVRRAIDGDVDAVYGSRFLRANRFILVFELANRLLTATTNLLYGSRLTDMETCQKVIRRDLLASLPLRARGFELEPEITGHLLARGVTIEELPIDYAPRDRRDGKKIRARDAAKAVHTLVRARIGFLLRPPAPPGS